MWRLILVLFLAALCSQGQARDWRGDWVNDGVDLPAIAQTELPKQAQETLALIDRGGPFPYDRDGITFGNYEKRLPFKPRGHYREFTVPTPGKHDRGARRIIVGGSNERYYTPDHYQHFWRIQP